MNEEPGINYGAQAQATKEGIQAKTRQPKQCDTSISEYLNLRQGPFASLYNYNNNHPPLSTMTNAQTVQKHGQ